AFARQGADVALAARGRDELDAVAGEIRALGRKDFIHVVDLADTDRAVNMVNAAAGELGSLDILVNNAGGITEVPGSMGPLAEATVDAFDAMYALNVRTPLFAAVAACRLMSRQGNGGAILNIVSIDALFPAPTEGIYGSAKAAVVNLTKGPRVRGRQGSDPRQRDRAGRHRHAPNGAVAANRGPAGGSRILLSAQPCRDSRRHRGRGRLSLLRRG